jgi:hypothetical protein
MEEQWKTLIDNPNYQISNIGNFKGLNNKTLRQNINKRGYRYCNISTKGKVTKVKIHRLVATYFVLNPLSLQTVNHIDGNKLNNHYQNLEWLTLKENIRHGVKIGLYNRSK